MPDTTDYTPTFPMFLPLDKNGLPELVSIDGNVCIALFTDKANVEKFCRDKYRGRHGWQSVPFSPFENAGQLRDFLVANEGPFGEQDCRCVAIDPVAGNPQLYAPIRDFVEYLATA